MIGVDVPVCDLEIAAEFFELFKTAWEPAIRGREYDAIVSTTGRVDGLKADVYFVYGSTRHDYDVDATPEATGAERPTLVQWGNWALPIYGGLVRFGAATSIDGLICDRRRVDRADARGTHVLHRIGYDLFAEVRTLLTDGQPAAQAGTPTLELHIDILRKLLQQAGVSFVEIPPRPLGYDFTCCLTHDVDFFGLRRHRLDRTLAGFMARASVGTMVDCLRRRRTVPEAVRNIRALLALPFVHFGFARDPWQPFEDYAAVEESTQSTFFLVPVKGRAGIAPDGSTQPARAVPYQASEIAQEARAASDRGSELAVHGIDAWRDTCAGRAELEQLTRISGAKTAGVRMHWLYFDRRSPAELDAAGFAYDSTWGYNETVGYRAGTSQVFRFPSTQLLELPLSIMDSSLFSARRMALAPDAALDLCTPILSNAKRLGGTLVLNWHERSLAPERLWGRFYAMLLKRITRDNRVWFATASQAVEWFRWRRSIRFSGDAVVAPAAPHAGATVRTHRATATGMHVRELPYRGGAPLDADLPAGNRTSIVQAR